MTTLQVNENDLTSVATLSITDRVRVLIGASSNNITFGDLLNIAGGKVPCIAAGGTADAITASYSPDITLSDCTIVAVVATAANATATPTFSADGLTAHTITKRGGQPLVAGDIPAPFAVCLLEYHLDNTRWELLNPASNTSGLTDKGLLTLSAAMDLPAASAGDWYLADGTQNWVGGTAHGDGRVWLNPGDKVFCIADTVAGQLAVVGAAWFFDIRTISLPVGYRYIEVADDTAETAVPVYGLRSVNGAWVKYENSVKYPIDSNRYEDICILASSFTPATVNGAAIVGDCLAFETAIEKIADIEVIFPSGWDRGTFKVKFDWRPGTDSGAVGDTVEWKVAAAAVSDGDAIATAVGTPQVISDAVLTDESATRHLSGATPAVTASGTPALADSIHLQISRNVSNDNHAYDAHLSRIWIQIKLTNAIAAW